MTDAMPRSAVRASLAGGVALGVAYALSPLTVWFIAVAVGLFVWAGRGLPDRERRCLIALLTAAVMLRLLALAVLFLTTDHFKTVSFFWDGDGVYLKQRALWIRNVWLDLPIAPVDFGNAFSREYGWTPYLYVIAYPQYLVGPAPYGIHLLNVAVFVATSILLYRVVRAAYGPWVALLGLAILLFLPTPFLWSISAMKESLYVFLEALTLAGAIAVLRSKNWAVKMLALGVIVAAVSANGAVRAGAFAISVLGLAAGVAGSMVVRRLSLVVVVLALLPLAGYQMLNRPSVGAAIMSQLKSSAVLHIGHARTEGHSYKVLDQRFYSGHPQTEPISTMTSMEGARFVIRSVASFVLVPLPWQVESLQEILFVPQQVAWYLLALLGLVGVVAGLRRDALVTCLLASFAAAGAAAIALNSGNIGTMVRHRDTLVPFIVWLSALGGVELASKLARLDAKPDQSRLDATRGQLAID
jgi:hypothetical protein